MKLTDYLKIRLNEALRNTLRIVAKLVYAHLLQPQGSRIVKTFIILLNMNKKIQLPR